MVEISVVIPVYGCADCLPTLHRRLVQTLAQLNSSYEIVFVDDRSSDGSWEAVSELAAADPAVKAVRLSRNFGQHAAITAGLATSYGRFTVVMDCDLQDPPEQISRLVAKAQEGYDIVLTRRPRRRQPILRRLSGTMYFYVRRALVGGSLENNMPNLSLLSRKVVDAFLTIRDKDRQYLLIVEWLGFRQAVIDIEQDERYVGRSSYGFGALLRVAIDGIFFQSTAVLRWVVYSGFGLALLGLALVAYTLVAWMVGRHLPSWTALPMLILFLSGFLTIAGGVTGLYVGKIFEQVKGRPLYVVDVKIVDGIERGVGRELDEYVRARAEPLGGGEPLVGGESWADPQATGS